MCSAIMPWFALALDYWLGELKLSNVVIYAGRASAAAAAADEEAAFTRRRPAAHRPPQGEGCEQGDALVPALYALGQHIALASADEQLQSGECLAAFPRRHLPRHDALPKPNADLSLF